MNLRKAIIIYHLKERILKVVCKKKYKGMTLIEVLVASTIGAIVLVGVTSFIYLTSSINREIVNLTNVQSIVAISSRQIEDEIKQGTFIQLLENNPSIANDAYSQVNIFNQQDLFVSGYRFVLQNNGKQTLIKCSEDGSELNKIFRFDNVYFDEAAFYKTSINYLNFNFELNVVNNETNEVLLKSGKLFYYAKCRNFKIE